MNIIPALGVNIKNFSNDILDGKTWRITSKIDGVRRLFYKSTIGDVFAYSRTGKEDKWLTHITEFLKPPWFPYDTVYDCELVDRDLYLTNAPSFLLRTETTGKASQQYPDNKEDLMAICFDIFKPEGDLRTGFERNDELKKIFSGFCSFDDPMIRVPYYGEIHGANMDIIKKFMDYEIDNNGEGLMLMDMDSIYISGRSKSLIKVKRFEEFTGKIIGFEIAREKTKIEGGIAAIICEVDGCTKPVRIGSGFNNYQRLEMAMDKNLIGKMVEIEAFSYSKDKKGCVSLNLPVFKQFVKGVCNEY